MATKSTSVPAVAKAIFPKLGLSLKSANAGVFAGTWGGSGAVLEKYSPIDGTLLGPDLTISPENHAAVTALVVA